MSLIRQLNAWRRDYQSSAVAIGLVLLVVVVFWLDQANDRQVIRQLQVAEINRTYRSCRDTVDFRTTFAEFLDQSARPSSAGVNFSQLASFAELDPATKRFLEELASVQSGGTNTVQAIADRYRERFFPLPDCERNRAVALDRLPG